MCGIAGELKWDRAATVHPAALRAMTDAIAHRGPDDAGQWSGPGIGLGHRRLSIIDLSSDGHQPMSTPDGDHWLVFNGEIYNFAVERALLERRGETLRSHSDTEVVLRLFARERLECLPRLRGMFAFAYYDCAEHELWLVRDRLGKKPLYYSMRDDGVVFASEIKALLAHGAVKPSVDLAALDQILAYGYVLAPRNLLSDVQTLPPGSWLRCSARGVEMGAYWKTPAPQLGEPRSAAQIEDELLDRIRESVRLRLVSDVPVGAFLSGGIDSSLVTAVMAAAVGKPVSTFCIGFDSPEYDERPAARAVARHLGTDHHELVVAPPAVEELLPKLIWHFDDAFADSSALPTYFVSQMAREHVKVVLSGDGGDELFAGYTQYAGERFARHWSRVPGGIRRAAPQLVEALAAGGPEAQRPRLWRVGRILRDASGDFVERFHRKRCLFGDAERSELWHPHLRQARAGEVRRRLEEIAAQGDWEDPVARLSYLDQNVYLPNDMLVKVDRMSMAHGLEVRCPLLDQEIVAFAARVPSSMKLHGLTTKWILRRLARRLVPAEISQRKKMGFSVPLRAWFRGDLDSYAQRMLLHPEAFTREYFQENAVRRLLEEHRAGRQDAARRIWALLAVEVWHQVYLGGASHS